MGHRTFAESVREAVLSSSELKDMTEDERNEFMMALTQARSMDDLPDGHKATVSKAKEELSARKARRGKQ